MLTWEDVTGDWRKLHNEELHDLYTPTNLVDESMEDEMGRACGMYDGEEKCRVVLGKPEGGPVEDLGVVGRIVLKWVLKNRMGRRGLY